MLVYLYFSDSLNWLIFAKIRFTELSKFNLISQKLTPMKNYWKFDSQK